MKRALAKKGTGKLNIRGKGGPIKDTAVKVRQDKCAFCETDLKNEKNVLFVEEDVGRVFCSEPCIVSYFSHDIERMEQEYLSSVQPWDFTAEERERLSELRWDTLANPQEIWCEKSISGDNRYTLISEYLEGTDTYWVVCLSLFLRGEPSFLYLAFPTRDRNMIDKYRRGEQVQWVKEGEKKEISISEKAEIADRLAEPWTADETLRAQLIKERRLDDIPEEDYGRYQACVEETLQGPDEIWNLQTDEKSSARLFHFIKNYSDTAPPYWFIIVAREAGSGDEIEVVDAFPTKDPELVGKYRQGIQELEIGQSAPVVSKLVH